MIILHLSHKIFWLGIEPLLYKIIPIHSQSLYSIKYACVWACIMNGLSHQSFICVDNLGTEWLLIQVNERSVVILLKYSLSSISL